MAESVTSECSVDESVFVPADVARRRDLTPSAKLLYAVLVSCADSDGFVRKTPQRCFAEQIGATDCYIPELIHQLEGAGLIEVARGDFRPTVRWGRPLNAYRVIVR